METEKLGHFKKRLEQERTLLEEELRSLGVRDEHTPGGWDAISSDTDGAATEQDEVADRIEEMEGNEGEINELSIQKKNVDRALIKIEGGTYGTCEMNDEAIEEDRLEANPSARTCKAHMDDESSLTN